MRDQPHQVDLPESSSFDILLLEDEVLLQDLLVEELTGEGWSVRAAASTAEAGRLLQNGDVRLLIADLGLGAGGNGHTFADSARRAVGSLAVIYTSGRPDLMDSRILGEREWLLPKPFRLHSLVRMVRSAMDGADGIGQADGSHFDVSVGRAPEP